MRVFVGGIPKGKDLLSLVEAFSAFNPIAATIARDKDSQRMKGFGFLEFGDDDGKRAIEEMNGIQWGDRTITVNTATPRSGARDGRRKGRDSS